jgi:hypothetical protein
MIKEGDRLQFNDAVAGHPDMRYLTFIGHKPSANPVQLRASADAASDGASSVTVTIDPPLQATVGKDQNVSDVVAVGMEVSVMPTHRAGMITAGNPLFIAMPTLPQEVPFPTANKVDPESGCSMRMYYGSLFGQNARGMIHDAVWGSKIVPEYAMAVLFPL